MTDWQRYRRFPDDVDLSMNGKKWSFEDLVDLVGYYELIGAKSTALMLSRTYKTTCAKYWELKKRGLLERYKKKFKLGDYYEEVES